MQRSLPSSTPRSLRLEAQDVALSRLKHGFESRRERHISVGPDARPHNAAAMQSEPAPADTIALPPLAGEGNGMGEARAVRGLSLSGPRHIRSEEHTSELQSLMRTSYVVCCLSIK